MDAVPKDVDIEAVRKYLLSLNGVTDVHDLHIWGLSTRETALTVHLRKPDADYEDEFIDKVNEELHDKFDIYHATIQIEKNENCSECHMKKV